MRTVPVPQDHIFYNNRGIDYGEKGEHDLAIKDFTKAIELKPDYAFAYNNRCAAKVQMEEIQARLNQLSKN